jgi:uncharacterized protein
VSRLQTLAFLLFALSCTSQSDAAGDEQYVSNPKIDSARIRLVRGRDTVVVNAELAGTPEQHTMGLMERTALAPDAGMLFLYPAMQPESAGFWMFRTRIPLDIAFIDSLGVIRSIQTMTPCEATVAQGCPTYPPGARYQAALEMNAGFFKRTGISVGDRLLLVDTLTRSSTGSPVKR